MQRPPIPPLKKEKKRKNRGFHRLANARAVSRSVRVTWSRRDEWDRTLCWRQLKTLKNRIVYFTLVNSFFPLVGLLIALAFRGFFYCLAIYGIIRYILLFFVLISLGAHPVFFFFSFSSIVRLFTAVNPRFTRLYILHWMPLYLS